MQPNVFNGLSTLPLINSGRSRTINAENPTGAKGAGGMASSHLGPSRKGSPCLTVKSGQTVTLAEVEGPGVIQHIWVTVTDKTSESERYVLRDILLRMYWDDEETPSVEAPLGDFFCMGFGESYPVNSALMAVNPLRGMNCYIPMPFGKKAKITIENQHANDIGGFFYQIDYCLYDDLPPGAGYFHAQWRRERLTDLQKDYTLLDNVRGSGHYIGTFIALATLERYWYGEGEMKFYLDGDDEYPTICGTGMEDYFGGAWSFATREGASMQETTYNTAYMGYPFYSDKDYAVDNNYHNRDCPPMRCFYRWHVMDPIRFASDLRVTLQQIGVGHGGLFERQDDLSSVSYWYQAEPHAPFPAPLGKKERWPR